MESRTRGQALFLVLVVMALVLAVGAAIVQMAQLNTERVRTNRLDEQLLNGSRTGLAQAKHLLWEKYLDWAQRVYERQPGNLTMAREYLDEAAQPKLPPGRTVEVAQMRLARGTVNGIPLQGQPLWVRVTATRWDTDDYNTHVLIRSVATVWDTRGGTVDRKARIAKQLPSHQRVSEQVLRYGGAPFEGFRFALLANSINCTFCHADIDNSRRIYNTDPRLLGKSPRARVASLESLEMRPHARSTIAGTLYVQGYLVDTAGKEMGLNHPAFSAPDGLKTVAMDAFGRILETPGSDPLSRLERQNFVEAKRGEAGNYVEKNGSFYRNYPTDPQLQLDGPVPDTFPPPIHDENGNRLVDQVEWDSHLKTMEGSLRGGIIHTVAGDGTYGSSRLPEQGNTAEFVGGTVSTSNKNVFLIGTPDNPIVVDGKVAIDGDVVISGVVKGSGQILARNNLYVLGDLTYADGKDATGNRTFGVAQDGTKNVVAYAAGGAIVHGAYSMGHKWDYKKVTGEKGSGESSGSWALQEVGWWNRTELTKSMPFFDPRREMPTADPGDPSDPNPPNIGWKGSPGPDGRRGTADDIAYTPRFYTLKENGTIWLFGPDNGKKDYTGAPTRWNNEKGYWMGDGNANVYGQSRTLQEVLAMMSDRSKGASGQTPAAIHGQLSDRAKVTTLALDPKGGWISQDTFRELQLAQDRARKAAGGAKPFKLDGLFYTNNGMLFMSRSNESGGGKIEFNGSVVAADTGILAGRHLQLNYDERTKDYLNIEDNTKVQLFVVAEREGIQ